MKEFLEPYFGELIAGAVAAIVAWFSKGRMLKADARSAEANAINAMQRAYDMYVEHNNKKMQEFEKEIKNLREELTKVEDYWRSKYNALKKEFTAYKRKNIG